MTRMHPILVRATPLAAVATLVCAAPAPAVIVYVNDTTATRNTVAPGGALANSGWQYQGQFGSFLGTPIAPQYFITAAHIGGPYAFVYNSVSYTVDGGPIDDPNSDLRIWKVAGTFPTFAPLYTQSNEVGKPLVVFGRGVPAGGVVTDEGTSTATEPKGFLWGAADAAQSWGENTVSNITNFPAGTGQALAFSFDRTGTIGRPAASANVPNEAALSDGDSGGGLFIQDTDGFYKLAGVNLGVDGPYSTEVTGTGQFGASIYDRGGLFTANRTPPFSSDSLTDQPGFSYSTRISSNLAFVNSVIPEPGSMGLFVAPAGLLLLRRRAARRC